MRRLQEDPTLEGVSHVIVDEAHERSADGDFLLMVLRRLLPRRPDLRVVLMSATLDAALFEGYFGGACRLTIPGRTFTVTPFFLEDCLEFTKHAISSSAPWARKAGAAERASGRGGKGGGQGGGRARYAASASAIDEPSGIDDAELDYSELRLRYPRHAPATAEALAASDLSSINYELCADLVVALLAAPPAQVVRRLRSLRRRLQLDSGADSGADGDGPAEEADAEDEQAGATAGGQLGEQLEERRLDITDGNAYTKAEFIEEYGGTSQWEMAQPIVSPRQPPPARSKGKVARAGGAKSAAKRAAGGEGGGGGGGEGGGGGGAVLCFLPGLREIETLVTLLKSRPELCAPAQQRWILPLHSTLTPEDQMKVFATPPAGLTKVVVATNIAETSITIDDVSFVVDTARMKENRYDPTRRLEALIEDFGSQANLTQRRGRAGRVRCGFAFHLVTSTSYTRLPAQQVPELQRVPLERVVLRAKKLYPDRSAAAVLSQLPEPPSAAAIRSAINVLTSLGALARTADADARPPPPARPHAQLSQRGLAPTPVPVPPLAERRIDVTDGNAYTQEQFREFYGDDRFWDAAQAAAAPSPPAVSSPLQAPAPSVPSPLAADGREDDEANGSNPEKLTALGHHLAALPVDVRIGKLIILGAMLQCADPALTLAAALSVRSPFVAPYGMRSQADESKANWSVGGSDHLAVLQAYQAWDALSGERRRLAFCQENFLSHRTLQTIAQTKRELLEHLWELDFLRAGASAAQHDVRATSRLDALDALSVAQRGGDDSDGVQAALGTSSSRNARDMELIKALLVGAMWPKVAKLEPPTAKGKGGGKGGGKGSGKGGSKGGGVTEGSTIIKVKDDTGVAAAVLHPSCVAAQAASAKALPRAGHLIFTELVATSCLFLRDLTVVSPVALMLFGGRLSVDPRAGLVLLDDGWVRFETTPEVARLVVLLRQQLEETLRLKIRNPALDFSREGDALIDAVVRLVAGEGAGAAPPPPKPVSTVSTVAYSLLYDP